MTAQTSSDWLGLSGRVGVVTGAGGGIGRAVASSLARAGAHVAAIDRDERGLEVTDAALRELGCEHVIATCDTSSAESVTAASETIERSLGPCSVLVNAAAVLRPGALDSLSLAEWNAILSVNLTGYFLCAQVFGRQMRKLGARLFQSPLVTVDRGDMRAGFREIDCDRAADAAARARHHADPAGESQPVR